MEIEYIQKCKCGAVTIRFDNGASNSMFWETFEKLDLDTGDATWLHQSYLDGIGEDIPYQKNQLIK